MTWTTATLTILACLACLWLGIRMGEWGLRRHLRADIERLIRIFYRLQEARFAPTTRKGKRMDESTWGDFQGCLGAIALRMSGGPLKARPSLSPNFNDFKPPRGGI